MCTPPARTHETTFNKRLRGGRSTWLVECRVVPELSALNQSLRSSTGTLNARVERSVLKAADSGGVVTKTLKPYCILARVVL